MITERRKEVYSWLENVIAAYENYLEFAEFPGLVDAQISATPHVIHINGLKNLCEYASIPYDRMELTKNLSILYIEFSGFRFYDREDK